MIAATSHRPPSISLKVERSDRWQPVTWLALAFGVAAVAMAIIGLPSVDLHMPPHHAGIMDPMCGGTRAVRFAAMGNWSESWRYNPIGIPFLVTVVLLILRAVVGWLSGRWLTIRIRWTGRGKLIAWLLLAAVVIALEINQQSNAALLMSQAAG